VKVDKLLLDSEMLYQAIDQKRRRMHLKRYEVAKILGVAPCTVTFWANGGGFRSSVALRAGHWLDRDLRDFTTIDTSDTKIIWPDGMALSGQK
jgi:hypothetical protein